MKNYNKFLAVKIIILALLSFNATAHTVKVETVSTQTSGSLDSCIKKNSRDAKSTDSIKFQQSISAVPTLFELATMLDVNLGGDAKADQSPEVLEAQHSSVMSLREMITLYGVKVL